MDEDNESEDQKEKVVDELSDELLDAALNFFRNKDYAGIAGVITGLSDANNDLYEKTFELVKGVFTKNEADEKKASNIIDHIFYLFAHHSNSVPSLDSNYISYASQFVPGTYPPSHESDVSNMMHEKVTKESLSRLTDFQLSNKIREVREQHKKLLSRGEKISKELVDNLSLLLEEKASRQGGNTTKKKVSDEDKNAREVLDVSTDVEKGKYKFWFVQPSSEEMSKTINIHVVCGSPFVEVLRRRYKKLYDLTEIQDVRPQDLMRGTPEAQYELQKEQKRQQDFVADFFDPKNISDQDICAYNIYNAFNTDQFPEVPRVREQANTLGTYFLKHGRLINRFNTEAKVHSLKIDGNIIGRFAVSFNKREKVSGRIISDSYEVVEYQAGRPVLYFYSIKGRSAMDGPTVKSINIAMRGLKMNLLTPVPAEMSDEKMLDKYKLQDQSSEDNVSDTVSPDEGAAETSVPEAGGLKTEAAPIETKLEPGPPVQPKKDVSGGGAASEASSPATAKSSADTSSDSAASSPAPTKAQPAKKVKVTSEEPKTATAETKSEPEPPVQPTTDVAGGTTAPEEVPAAASTAPAATDTPSDSAASSPAPAKAQPAKKVRVASEGPKTATAETKSEPEPQAKPAKDVPEESVGGSGNSEDVTLPANELRAQLIDGVKKKYSQSTLRYLLKQISEKEGKSVDEITKEIETTVPEAAELLGDKKLNVGIIKERAKKLKESMDGDDNKADDKAS